MIDSSISIYLIEDNKVDSLIEESVIKKTLPQATISIFFQAQVALKELQHTLAHPQSDSFPDLILLDIAMPGMDGFAFLEHCLGLQLHTLSTPPLIYILTTSLSALYLQKAKSHLYVTDVLFKPFSQQAFAALLDKHFPHSAYSKPIEQPLINREKLTLENWVSEYKRLESKYLQQKDKQSLVARGLLDHLEAVWMIIHEYNNNNKR